ncbi:MAG: hypothetical protein ACREGE_01105 [Candidatus Microsaccharimonas sp.]
MIISSIVGLTLLLALSIFQIFLIAGKPWGEFAWGGQHKVLPKKLRIGSITSIFLYIIFGIFLASKAGLITLIPSQAIVDVGMWIITGYLILGIFMNGISRSKKERFLMTPVALVLAIVFFFTALGGN